MADDGQDRVVPDDERARQILEQLKGVHTFDLAYETMVGLVNFGSQKMGLLDETRAVRDLDDARLSIELVRAILEVVGRGQGPERTRGLHDALAQMQLAYAHAVQLDNAERAAARESAGESGPAVTEGPAPGSAPTAKKPAAKTPAAKKQPAAKKKPAADEPAAGETASRKSAAGKKPVPGKKPADEV